MTTHAVAGTFDEANAQYKTGDYKAATKEYLDILKSDKGTSAVAYNLGNALLRSGKKGPALLAYERALKADPRNKDIRWNIGVVQSMLTDRREEQGLPWLEQLREWLGWISINETAWGLLGFMTALAILGWLGFAAAGRIPGLGFLKAVSLAGALVTAGVFFLQYQEDRAVRVITLDPEVTLRYGPAFSETKAFILHEGAAVRVFDDSGDWWYVSFGKNAGWMPKKSGEII